MLRLDVIIPGAKVKAQEMAAQDIHRVGRVVAGEPPAGAQVPFQDLPGPVVSGRNPPGEVIFGIEAPALPERDFKRDVRRPRHGADQTAQVVKQIGRDGKQRPVGMQGRDMKDVRAERDRPEGHGERHLPGGLHLTEIHGLQNDSQPVEHQDDGQPDLREEIAEIMPVFGEQMQEALLEIRSEAAVYNRKRALARKSGDRRIGEHLQTELIPGFAFGTEADTVRDSRIPVAEIAEDRPGTTLGQRGVETEPSFRRRLGDDDHGVDKRSAMALDQAVQHSERTRVVAIVRTQVRTACREGDPELLSGNRGCQNRQTQQQKPETHRGISSPLGYDRSQHDSIQLQFLLRQM